MHGLTPGVRQNPPNEAPHQTCIMWLALALSFTLAADSEGWQLAGRADAFQARWYTRPTPSTPVHELKATGRFELPPDALLAVLLDFDGYVRSMPSTAASKVVLRERDDVAWVYLRYDLPLIAPRESVVRMQLERNGPVTRLSWALGGAREDLVPLTPGVIRVEVNEGNWTLEPRDEGRATFVTYRLLSAPGGDVPVSFVNRVNGAGVPRTFEALDTAARRRREAR